MKGQQEQLKISFEHAENQNTIETINAVKKLLEEQKEKGNLDFVLNLRRKCDYCEKTLEKGDKFTTIQEGNNLLDKCEDCEKKGK